MKRIYFDSLTLVLALDEPLPGEPKTLPSKAPHLTDYFFVTNRGSMIKTTIDPGLQARATEIINSHQKDLAENYIFNSACIIVSVESGNVLAYVGNSTLGRMPIYMEGMLILYGLYEVREAYLNHCYMPEYNSQAIFCPGPSSLMSRQDFRDFHQKILIKAITEP